MDWQTRKRKCPVDLEEGQKKGELFSWATSCIPAQFRPIKAIHFFINIKFAFNIAACVHHDSENKQFILLRFILKKTKTPVPTLVLAAALALCGLDQPGISLPPRLSQDGTPPPLSPDEDRERQSEAVQLLVWQDYCTYRQFCRLDERPPASCPLLLKNWDFLCPVSQHFRLARLCRFGPTGEAVEV